MFFAFSLSGFYSERVYSQELRISSACYRGANQTASIQVTIDSSCGVPGGVTLFIIEDNDTVPALNWPDGRDNANYQLGSFNNQKFFLAAFDFCGQDSAVSNIAGLDAEAPSAVTIDSVSYLTGDVVLGWQPVNDSDVVGYVVNELTQLNPPLFSETARVNGRETGFYRSSNESDSIQESITYVVTAIDRCGIESSSTDFHSSLYLDSIQNVNCTEDYQFSFDEVEGFDEPLQYRAVFVNQDRNEKLNIDLGAYQPSFSIRGLRRFDQYTFTVVAIAEQAGITQQSNSLEFFAGSKPFSGNVNIVEIQQEDNQFVVTSEITGYEPQYEYQIAWEGARGSRGRTSIDAGEGIQETSIRPSGTSPYDFTVEVLDDCESESATSNTVSVSEPELRNTEVGFVVSNSPISGQRYKLFGGLENRTFRLLDEDISFPYQLPVNSDRLDQPYCIFIRAIDDAGNVLYSSDTLCSILKPAIHIPSAFRPSSGVEENQKFGVKGSFFNLGTVEMSIYNRWGELVYQGVGEQSIWDGSYNDGTMADPGIYLYDIELLGEDQQPYYYDGTVQLLR